MKSEKNKLRNYRTDLAIELKNINKYEGVDFEGIEMNIEEDKEKRVKVTNIKIENKKGEEILGKPIGTYITIESKEMKTSDKEIKDEIIKIGKKKLVSMIGEKKYNKILVVGIGNRDVTPDALGPKTISKILVTSHLKDSLDKSLQKKIEDVSCIATGVMGQTGIETVELVKSTVKTIKADLVIVIDALAGSDINKLNNAIQFSNTGIIPGSGVGNNRKGLNEETLKVKVISIGVPTVVDTATLIKDSVNMIIKKTKDLKPEIMDIFNKLYELDDEEQYKLIKNGLTDDLKGMFVTTREIDQTINRISNIVANIINLSLHKGLDAGDINYFME